MNYTEYMNAWVKSELTQSKIMIGIGILLVVLLLIIYRGQSNLLKGTMIPLGLLAVVLIGYGAFIITSRPAHASKSIALYEKSKEEGKQKEIEKHINDNKAGKTLTKFVYPGFIIFSAIALLFLNSPYYKGIALGFIILFVATYIMDSGFISRSDAFLEYLQKLKN